MQANTSPFGGTESSKATRWRRLTLALAFASVLGACGGGDGEPEVPAPAPSPAPAPTPVVERQVPVYRANGVPVPLLDTQRTDGALTQGLPLPAPMTFIASSSSLPNLALEDSRLLHATMPPGRALAPDGTLVYLDRLAMQIVRVSKTGEVRLQPSLGRADGAAAQGFWSPTAFAVDRQGNAYVADGWYAPCTVSPCSGGAPNLMGQGAWPGVWKISPSGEATRLAGIVSGDALTGMVDGDPARAQFSAITQLVAADDGSLYAVDQQRVLVTDNANPNLRRYAWDGTAVRRIAPNGEVTTVRPLQANGTTLFRRDDGRVVMLGDKQVLDAATGQVTGDNPRQFFEIRSGQMGSQHGQDPLAWRNSRDRAGHTWLMGSFAMFPTAPGMTQLNLLSVTRHDAEGAVLPGSLLLHWACTLVEHGISGYAAERDCPFRQLGVADDQHLYGLIQGDLVRIDVQALLPK